MNEDPFFGRGASPLFKFMPFYAHLSFFSLHIEMHQSAAIGFLLHAAMGLQRKEKKRETGFSYSRNKKEAGEGRKSGRESTQSIIRSLTSEKGKKYITRPQF